jgi:elongation factor Ts
MVSSSSHDVRRLGSITGADVVECLRALDRANGDFEKARIILEAGKPGGRKIVGTIGVSGTSEAAGMHARCMSMVALRCETDWTATRPEFVELANKIAMRVNSYGVFDMAGIHRMSIARSQDATAVPLETYLVQEAHAFGEKIELKKAIHMEGEFIVAYVHPPGTEAAMVSCNDVKKEVASESMRAMIEAILSAVAMHIVEQKPEYISRKHITTRIKETVMRGMVPDDVAMSEAEKAVRNGYERFIAEKCLMNQPFAFNKNMTVEEFLEAKSTAIGTRITISRFERITVAH